MHGRQFLCGVRRGESSESGSNMSEQADAGSALALATLMMLCALLAYYLERSKTVWLTESGAAMVLGIVCGGIWKLADSATASKMSFDDSNFFIILLPPIILEAGFSMKKKKFFEVLLHLFCPLFQKDSQ